MSREYEYIFNQLVNPLRLSNFDSYFDDGSKVSFNRHKFNNKVTSVVQKRTGKVLEYSVRMREYSSDKDILLVNYRSNAVPFQPEHRRYYEPTWQDFTDNELSKAIEYLTPLLKMKMNVNRDHYKMLVFKDKFHLSIRYPDFYETTEHCLCITAYDCSLN